PTSSSPDQPTSDQSAADTAVVPVGGPTELTPATALDLDQEVNDDNDVTADAGFEPTATSPSIGSQAETKTSSSDNTWWQLFNLGLWWIPVILAPLVLLGLIIYRRRR